LCSKKRVAIGTFTQSSCVDVDPAGQAHAAIELGLREHAAVRLARLGRVAGDFDAAFAADTLASAGRLQDDAGLARRLDQQRSGQTNTVRPSGSNVTRIGSLAAAGMVSRLCKTNGSFHRRGAENTENHKDSGFQFLL